MLKKLVQIASKIPALRREINRQIYQSIARWDQGGRLTLMNYGYHDLRPDAPAVPLAADDEANRYCLQLYHHVAAGADLHGRAVLEVGSGRGGGASYIRRAFDPQQMTGLDYSAGAIAFCQAHHRIEGLAFIEGDAENLPFDPAVFDAVINIESSHCYGSMRRFLQEVCRVLRPGGYLLWADFRPVDHLPRLREDIAAAGLTIRQEEDITGNVVAAMERLTAERRAMIDTTVPGWLRKPFKNFAGIKEESTVYEMLVSGELLYPYYIMQK